MYGGSVLLPHPLLITLMIWPKATGNYDWCIKGGTLQTFIPQINGETSNS